MPTYNKNFLTNVLYRLDFNEIPSLSTKTQLLAVYEQLRARFSVNQIVESVEGVVAINPLTNQLSSNPRQIIQLVCNTTDNNARIILDKRSLVVEVLNKSYNDLHNFIEFITSANNLIKDFKTNIKINRLGLRYVNQIDLTSGLPFENTDFINENLTTKERTFFDPDWKSKINRSISQTSLSFDDYGVNFVNGYANSQFPGRVVKNEYLIDIDCFASTCEFDNIIPLITAMNTDTITPLFEKSINSGLRELMSQEG